MPRYTHFNDTALTASAFSKLAHRLSTYQGEIYPFHVGDTWMEPAVGCRMQDLRVEDHPGMHRYSPPRGLPELIDALAARVGERSGLPTTGSQLLIAAGATGALGAAAGALLDPGDEVLILAPHWPLIKGIVGSFRGRPVQVPFFGRADSPETAVEVVREALTSRTVALYLNTPCNPTGEIIPRSWLEALVAWAQTEDLWILADEVYEDYQYRGEHTYCRPLAPERTLACYSFSKAYGMAGNRCGYVVGPEQVISELLKVSTHTFYSTPTAAQIAAHRVLGAAGDAWVREAREHYRQMGEETARRLDVEPPAGGTFLFLDIAEQLGDRSLAAFLEECADRGLFLAPGPSFGPYPTSIRVCFTCAPPERVRRGVEILADLLAG